MTLPAKIYTLLLAAALLGFAIHARAAADAGRVCVQKIPSGPNSSWKANDSGATARSVFKVKIDDLPAINVTTSASGVFTNLSLVRMHLVTIKLDGKPLTSFRFSFENSRAPHLKLWYNEFYGTWSLSDVKPGQKCACPVSESPK